MARTDSQTPPDRTSGRTAGRVKRRWPKPKLQPPLTPMIDVTFQLLLFFLLTTTWRAEEGQIPTSLPQSRGISAGQTVELAPVFIVLRSTGGAQTGCLYEMTGQPIAMDSPKQLYEALLARRNQLGADEPVIIQPQRNVPWRFVVEAFNQAVRAKCKKIGFAAAP